MSRVELLELLNQTALLEPDLLRALAQEAPAEDARALIVLITKRGWLTAFQANELARGRGHLLVLGPYTFLERLGSGGMGEVFKARQRMLGRIEALKLIRRDLLLHPAARERFKREMQAVALLNHPNIVQAYSAGQEGERHYLSMELIEGTDLNSLIRDRGPLALSLACEYVRQAALGLQHAHERGLVHRDIKPANLLLTTNNNATIKILDFGLARLQESTGPVSSPDTVMGTPDFMAPEQIENVQPLDIRADIFALGATFYFLLTGQTPFPAPSFPILMARRVQNAIEPIEKLRPDLPLELRTYLLRMMAKHRHDRPSTPLEVARVLESFSSTKTALPVGPSPASVTFDLRKKASAESLATASFPEAIPLPPRRSRHRQLFAASIGLLLLLVFVLWLTRGRRDETRTPSQSSLDRLSHDDIPEADRSDLPSEVVAVIGERRLRHWGPITSLALNADGTRLVSGGEDRTVRVWDLPGGEEIATLTGHRQAINQVLFHPDGKRVLSSSPDGDVRVWDLAKKSLRKQFAIRPDVSALALLDASTLLIGVHEGRVEARDLDRDTPPRVLLTPGKLWVRALALSPDGKLLAVGGSARNAGSLLMLDTESGVPHPMLDDRFEGSFKSLTFSRDGRKLIVGTRGETQIYEVADGRRERPIPFPREMREDTISEAVVEDRRTLAVAVKENVYLFDPRAPRPPNLLRVGREPIRAMVLSPDGERLVTGAADGTVRLWQLSPRGGEPETTLQSHVGPLLSVAATPDGNRLATGGADGGVRLWKRKADGFGDAAALISRGSPIHDLVFLDNGRRLVFRVGPDEIQVWDTSASKPERLHVLTINEGRDSKLVCRADGRFAWSIAPGAIHRWDMSTGKEDGRFEVKLGHDLSDLALSPDEKVLAIISAVGHVELWNLDPVLLVKRIQRQEDFSTGQVRFTVPRQFLCVHGDKPQLLLYDLAGTDRSLTLTSHTARITFAASVNEGRHLVTTDLNGVIAFSQPTDGKAVWSRRLPGPIHNAFLTSDARHLLTANGNGTSYLLRLPSFDK